MELTTQEIARVFAMYLGSPYKRYEPGEPKDYDYLFVGAAVLVELLSPTYPSHLYERKLLLTPLEQITDEDAVEVAKIFRSDILWDNVSVEPYCVKIKGALNGEHQCTLTVWHDMDFEFKWDDGTHTMQPDNNYSYKLRELLISRSYSVPLFFGIDHWANGMDAIQLGIAVAKTKE